MPLVNNLIVVPAKRNLGLGTTLLCHAEDRAHELGYSRVVLGVELDKADARRLYERQGYLEWPHGVITSTWTETDDLGQQTVKSEDTVVLVKTLWLAPC